MTAIPFLTVDDHTITLAQAIGHLQNSGRFSAFLWEILKEDLVERESQKILPPEDPVIEQAIIDFRLQNQLDTLDTFQAWLERLGLSYAAFRQQILSDIRLQRLKDEIVSQKNIQEYFEKQKKSLDQFTLSRITVSNEGEAIELKSQINDDGVSFEQLAREYSVTGDSITNGLMGTIQRSEIPDVLEVVIDGATPGEVLGPIELDGLFYLLRIENFLPAKLDEELSYQLREELFEKWLDDKIQQMNVKLDVSLDDPS